MIKFKISKDVKGNISESSYNLPTSLDEIDKSYYLAQTEDIEVAPNYSLVALICKEEPSVVIANTKKNKNSVSMCVPLFIKTNRNTSADEFIAQAKIGDHLIITGSDLALSQTVPGIANVLDINYFVALANQNPTIYKDSITIRQKGCFVSFKVVPNSFIRGFRTKDKVNISKVNKAFITPPSSTGEMK